MSTELGYGEIDVDYTLYVKVAQRFEPVPAELKPLEAALRVADPYRRVGTASDLPTASRLLHEHCVACFYDFEKDGYTVDLAGGDDSRWDPVLKDWRKILHGAARIYAVKAAGKPTLWLNAVTRGAIGEPPPAELPA